MVGWLVEGRRPDQDGHFPRRLVAWHVGAQLRLVRQIRNTAVPPLPDKSIHADLSSLHSSRAATHCVCISASTNSLNPQVAVTDAQTAISGTGNGRSPGPVVPGSVPAALPPCVSLRAVPTRATVAVHPALRLALHSTTRRACNVVNVGPPDRAGYDAHRAPRARIPSYKSAALETPLPGPDARGNLGTAGR